MPVSKLLIANRGEIAIRIARAAAELGIATVAVFSQEDAASLHLQRADAAHALPGSGAAAYLDMDALLAAAGATGCDAVHPGYGFLSENALFARRCGQEQLAFVGPRVEILELFGDKIRARAAAAHAGLPILPGTSTPTTLEQAQAFFTSLPRDGAMVIKAIAGGSGRGMRVVQRLEELEEALTRCQSEAQAAFGYREVYIEQFLPRARHIKVQIVGDGSGAVSHLGERDCSIQRRHQKLVEIAPSPGLPEGLRQRLLNAAVTLARTVRYDNLGTFEFLVDTTTFADESLFAFIERTALVRHSSRMFLIGANLSVPFFTIVLRKSYSLGAIAMAGDRLRHHTLPFPGQPENLVVWGWKARSNWVIATSWRRSPMPTNACASMKTWWRKPTSMARASTMPPISALTIPSTP